jgi:hypothetical protein
MSKKFLSAAGAALRVRAISTSSTDPTAKNRPNANIAKTLSSPPVMIIMMIIMMMVMIMIMIMMIL